MSEKVKVLFFSALPKKWQKLEVGDEFRAIVRSVEGKNFLILTVSGSTPSDLETALSEHKPEIVHLSVHAYPDEFFFENAEKEEKSVSKHALAKWFFHLTKKPRMIFLNACSSADNIESLKQVVDFIVATRCKTVDKFAVKFAPKFYEFLSKEETPKAAFNLTKDHFEREGMKEKAEMYELFVREGVDEAITFIPYKAKTEKSKEIHYRVKVEGNVGAVNSFTKNKIENITFNNK